MHAAGERRQADDAAARWRAELADRLIRIFTRDDDGRRPVYGGTQKFQDDPHWRDLILFYEYFHGDNGAGLGAIHQTGWTGLVAIADRRVAAVTAGQKRKKAKGNRPAINEFLFPLFVPRAMTAVSCRARRRPYQERGGPPVAQMRPKFRQTWRQRPVKRRLPIVHC